MPRGTEEAGVGRKIDLVISLNMGCEEEERNKGDSSGCRSLSGSSRDHNDNCHDNHNRS